MTDEQRRARLGIRHRLAAPATDALETTRSMLALHSSDPTTVFLTIWARVPGFETADLERLLYDDRSLLRIYGMRRTLWVVDRATLPIVHCSTTQTLGAAERRRTIGLIERFGVSDDGAAWLDRMLPLVREFIADRGEVLARDLSAEIPELAERITFYNKAGRPMGTSGMSSRALTQLALESRVIRTRPAGTWISGQYRWADMETWLGGPIDRLAPEDAGADLVSRWLRVFGPGTEADLKWWTGWPVRQVRAALARVSAVEVETSDGIALLHPDDLDPVEVPGPWVALLPALDPTTMGWKERGWFIADHGPELFDRNGNAGPTIWADGRIVGGWAQRPDGEVVYELVEEVGPDIVNTIVERIGDLRSWLGDVTIKPRFRSPLHDRLAR
jgi:DNA glycosylase AlkZ-like